MQDSDRHPASNQHPILKSMSEFYVTDIWTSDLCPFYKFSNRHSILKSMSFFKFSNRHPILKSMAISRLLKSTPNNVTDVCPNPNPNQ